MRSKDTHATADQFAKQVVFDVLPLVLEIRQLLGQCHLSLGKYLALCVLAMLVHPAMHSERSRVLHGSIYCIA
jgi:hypothetical protein